MQQTNKNSEINGLKFGQKNIKILKPKTMYVFTLKDTHIWQ